MADCVTACFQGFTGGGAKPKAGPKFSKADALAAAEKVKSNQENIVKDICNAGPTGVLGGGMTQKNLKRLHPQESGVVSRMIDAVHARLSGRSATAPSSVDEARVWMEAAKFFAGRIQTTAGQCQGRAPDMNAGAGAALKDVLGQIEACGKLVSNRETVVRDITNPGPTGVNGGKLSQPSLKRLSPADAKIVDSMLSAVAARLLGGTGEASNEEDGKVWMAGAAFFAKRVQGSAAECSGRAADMSPGAAAALKAALGQIEAATKLKFNRETCEKDICNPGPAGVKGGKMSQARMARLSASDAPHINKMLSAVLARLNGSAATAPSSVDEARAWVAGAQFFAKRIQFSDAQCMGRKADMGTNGAAALRVACAEVEACAALVNNQETVVKDICNPGPTGVNGGRLTQKGLRRCQPNQSGQVAAFVKAVSVRLLGGEAAASGDDARVWAQAAVFFKGRIQADAKECPGRAADMSAAAAAQMKAVLAGFV